jgi:DNA topoisomerase-3
LGKKLIITEKPSVAQDFAKVFGVTGRQNGFIENNNYVITWCVGHLVEMVYPEEYDIKYKKWMLEDLPFLPETYKYGVIKNVSQQYDIVNKLLHREDIDTVYWAGDSGKEGQTIEENIRNFGGVREGMTELRVWIDSQTEEEIRRGVNEAKPMSEYANLGASGIMRSIEDYAMGINFSRVMSVKYGNMLNGAAATKSYTAIAVGRVMTCVLGMVVNREREIRNFKETPFYRVVGSFSDAEIEAEWKAIEGSKYFESPKLYKENGFKEKQEAETLISSFEGKEAIIKTLEKGISKKKAPLLFNLAELQAECSKRFKISPDETLQVAQDLYEKKLTTYPRTDARVLTTAVSKEIVKNISNLKGYNATQKFVGNILDNKLYSNLAKTQYVDDSKVTDHYAIIPTGQLTELKSLNPLQSKVFDLIVRRFLSIFYPPAEYQTLKLVIGIENGNFKENLFASAKVLKSLGYLEVMGKTLEDADNSDSDDKNNDDKTAVKNSGKLLKLADTLKQGDTISVNGYEIKESKTSPPKRYTSGSMILAMENAGQLIEDEELRAQIKGSGIGTSATRAEIIKKLIRIGYLNLNAKTQIITPMNFGEMVYEVVAMTVPALLNPQMTASWEKGLDGITRGTVDVKDYRAKLEDFIRRETNHIKENDLSRPLANKISDFAEKGATGLAARKKLGVACPICGGDIVQTPFGFGCSNYDKENENSCKFAIGKLLGKDLTEAQVKELLTAGRTSTIRGFKSKAGKKFDARVALSKDENGKVTGLKFDFEDLEQQKLKDAKCPICGGDVVKTQFGYGCSNYNKDDAEHSCRFSINSKIAGLKMTDTIVKKLLADKKTDVLKGFTAKSGSKFDAPLKLNDEGQVVFDFPERPKPTETELICPRCKTNKLSKSQWYYECSCGFKVGHTVAQLPLPEDIVKELFETGKTKQKVTGFISKAGNPFETCLKFENERIQFDFDNPGEVSAPKSDDNGSGELPWLSPQGEAVTITAQPDVAESNFLESKLHEI